MIVLASRHVRNVSRERLGLATPPPYLSQASCCEIVGRVLDMDSDAAAVWKGDLQIAIWSRALDSPFIHCPSTSTRLGLYEPWLLQLAMNLISLSPNVACEVSPSGFSYQALVYLVDQKVEVCPGVGSCNLGRKRRGRSFRTPSACRPSDLYLHMLEKSLPGAFSQNPWPRQTSSTASRTSLRVVAMCMVLNSLHSEISGRATRCTDVTAGPEPHRLAF